MINNMTNKQLISDLSGLSGALDNVCSSSEEAEVRGYYAALEAEALRRMTPVHAGRAVNLRQLPDDYVHPSGLAMGGYWALAEGDRLVVVAKNKEDLPSCSL